MQLEELIAKFFSNEISESEKSTLMKLLQEEENQKLFTEYEQVWTASTKVADNKKKYSTDSAWEKQKSRMAQREKTNYWPLFRAASVVVLILAVGSIFISQRNATKLIVHSTAEQKEKIELADGTIVWLNERSSFSYSNKYGKKNRLVSLEGEAYFEVEKNEEMPFEITLPSELTVTVLGTSFNINTHIPEVTKVAVLSGKVKFGKEENFVLLEKNEIGKV